MKIREERKRVRLGAHIRSGSGWTDVSIHNVSPRGMMLRADRAPKPGSYVEVRRNDAYYTVRTVWVNGHLFGVRLQERIDVAKVVAERPLISGDGPSAADWRIQPAPDSEGSRAFARVFQFGLALGVVAAVAAVIGGSVHGVLKGPVQAISHHLAGAAAE